MKRILSILCVLVILFAFSVTCFAAGTYIPKTIELNVDPSTATLSSPTTVYIGDSVTWLNGHFNLRDYLNAPENYSMIFPSSIQVYNNGNYIGSFGDISGDYLTYTFNDFSAGSVVFVATEYMIGGPPGWTYDEPIEIFNIKLVDPNAPPETVSPIEVTASVFEGFFNMTTQLVRTIMGHSLLIVAVVISLVGLGIGLFVRFKK